MRLTLTLAIAAVVVSALLSGSVSRAYETEDFRGSIMEVNLDDGIVSVQSVSAASNTEEPVKETIPFPVTKDTRLLQGSDDIELEDLMAGQFVNVLFYTEKGEITTLSIDADM